MNEIQKSISNFNGNSITPLCIIMQDQKSDKSLGHHNYTTIYYELFKDLRYSKLNIFELGIGTNNLNIPSNMGKNAKIGASLFGWEQFFPNSIIYGADIDTDILFKTDRIKTFYCDQTNLIDIKNLWDNIKNTEFDIIIDDGLHTFDANFLFFKESMYKLKKGGYYIIEDINIAEVKKYKYEFSKWKNLFYFQIIQIDNPYNIHSFDNVLLISKRKD
jgi:hypothetical protein